MSTITTRSGKGSPLTNTEVDNNFTNLNNDKIENIVEDTAPQLGGDLDTNSNHIYLDQGHFLKFDGNSFNYYMGYGTYANVIRSGNRALDLNVGDASNNYTLSIQNGVYGTGHKYAATFSPSGQQTLYSANLQKLKTQAYGIQVLGDTTNGSGTIQLNCEYNSHGVKIKGPPHSAAASYTLTLPNDDGTNGQSLTTDGSGNLSWTTVSGSYGDSDVDTHLNQSSASASDVLSWNGSDYAWVAQSSGGSGITVKDEGSGLSTAATILNFTGAGVTASGTGSEKTINISGASSSGAQIEMTKVNASPSPASFPTDTWIKIADFSGMNVTASVSNFVVDMTFEGAPSEYAGIYIRLYIRTETTYSGRRWVEWEIMNTPRPWDSYFARTVLNYYNSDSFKMIWNGSYASSIYVKLPASNNFQSTNCFAKLVSSAPEVSNDVNGADALTIATNQSWLTSEPTGSVNTGSYGTGKLFENVTVINGVAFCGNDLDDNKATYLIPQEPSDNNFLKLPDGTGALLGFSNSSQGVIADGTANQVLTTNGAGTLTFSDATATNILSGNTNGRPTSPSAGAVYYNTTTNFIEFYNGTEWKELDTFSTAPTASAQQTYNISSGSDGNYYASWGYFPVGYRVSAYSSARTTASGTISSTAWPPQTGITVESVYVYSNPGGSGLVILLDGSSPTNSGWTRVDWERQDGTNQGSCLRTAMTFSTNTDTTYSWTGRYQIHSSGSFTGTNPWTTAGQTGSSAPPAWRIKIF